MAWFVAYDQEAMELLDAAAEMAAAALAARSRRVDEDGVIKRSVDMGRIKLHSLRAAMHTAPLADYDELPPDVAAAVERAFALFLETDDLHERKTLWRALRAYLLRPGSQEPFAGGEKPWADDDLSGRSVAGAAKTASRQPSAVRGVSAENGEGNPSPKAAE